jgi:tellurite resistance protein
MSLFHKTQENAGPVTFTDKEAVVALLFLIVTADGAIAPEEEELVIAASNRMKLLRGQGIDQFNDAVQKIRDAIEAKGRDEVFAAGIAALPAELRETVYALAADVVFADGSIDAQENEFLRGMQEALQVPDDLATKVLEVMRIKNKG